MVSRLTPHNKTVIKIVHRFWKAWKAVQCITDRVQFVLRWSSCVVVYRWMTCARRIYLMRKTVSNGPKINPITRIFIRILSDVVKCFNQNVNFVKRFQAPKELHFKVCVPSALCLAVSLQQGGRQLEHKLRNEAVIVAVAIAIWSWNFCYSIPHHLKVCWQKCM